MEGPKLWKPGKFGKTAAKHIGGLLFLIRGTRKDMLNAVVTLSQQLSKWCSAADRRLTRGFGYLSVTLGFCLVA